MYLTINFNMLLASVLVVLSASGDAQAAPSKRGAVVSMPIRAIHDVRRSEIHPHILLGQHMNRAHRRLAKMAGREAPSSLEMREHLERRVAAVHQGFALGQHSHSKRYVVLPAKGEGSELLATKPVKGAGRFRGKKAKAAGAAGAGAGAAAAGLGASDAVAAGADATGATATNSTAVGATGTNSTAVGATGGATGTNSTAVGATGGATGSTSSVAGNAAAGVNPIDIKAAAAGGLTNGNTPTANQSIALDIEANDVGYIGAVQIGTPPRTFLQLMDSGSADFWVGGEACQSQAGGGCGNHTFLGTQSSSSFKQSATTFQVTYGTGNVAGNVVQDNVVLAGLPLNAHTFGVATSESVDFSSNQTPFDGLIGLAQSTLSQQKVLTPVESLAKAGTIQEAITSFKISRLADQKNDGEVTFGGVDSTKFDANTAVTFKNVNANGFWEGAMAPTVNGKSVGLDQGRTAILDTGTTLIVAPASDAAAVHAAITGAKADGQGGFTVPCTLSDVVSLTFSNQTFDIDPRDVAFLPVNNNDPTGDCVSGISSGNIGGPTEWLVGDVFLKNAYFSTNVNQNTVTLAKLV